MTETYKYKSKIATAISFIAAFIVYIGREGLTQIMPTEYANLIPIIILIAGYILTQSTENKRVEVAEQMIHEQYTGAAPGLTTDEQIEPITGDENEDDIC